MKVTQTERQKRGKIKKGILKNEESLRDVKDNIKQNSIHIIEPPEGEKKGKGQKTFEEIIAADFHLEKKTPRARKVQKVQNKMNLKKKPYTKTH